MAEIVSCNDAAQRQMVWDVAGWMIDGDVRAGNGSDTARRRSENETYRRCMADIEFVRLS